MKCNVMKCNIEAHSGLSVLGSSQLVKSFNPLGSLSRKYVRITELNSYYLRLLLYLFEEIII